AGGRGPQGESVTLAVVTDRVVNMVLPPAPQRWSSPQPTEHLAGRPQKAYPALKVCVSPEGAPGPLSRYSANTLAGVGGPPATDRLGPDAKHLCDVGVAEAHLAAPQGTQAQRLENLIGQATGVRQQDGHDSSLLPPTFILPRPRFHPRPLSIYRPEVIRKALG